jgi:hypothetical protein
MAALPLVNRIECGSPAAAIERAQGFGKHLARLYKGAGSRQALADISVEKGKSF